MPTALAPGNLLLSIFRPAPARKKSYPSRRFTLTHLGRTEGLVIGTRSPERGEFLLTVTASTLRPVQLRFTNVPSAETLKCALTDPAPFEISLHDVDGSPRHRQLLPYNFAGQFRQKLSN